MKRKTIVLLILWSLAIIALVFTSLELKFTLLDRYSVSHLAIITAFLITSLFLLNDNLARLGYLHLLVLCFVILLHPYSEIFGRSGTPIIFTAYFFVLLYSTRLLKTEYKLLASTILLCIIILEVIAPKIDRIGFDRKNNLKEWADFVDGHNLHAGGYFLPDINEIIVGEFDGARFITNNHGFRNENTIDLKKPHNTYRILFIGDSFVVGYRSDQNDMIGEVLQRELTKHSNRRIEVLNAGVHDTIWAGTYLREYGYKFDPDLVIIGITLGNDISGSYVTKNKLNFRNGTVANTLLPDSAFDVAGLKGIKLRLDRSLMGWSIYKLTRRFIRKYSIASWYGDYPTRVHAFDIIHSLGHYFDGEKLDTVEKSFLSLEEALKTLKIQTVNSKLMVTLFPQRFQVSEADWRNTIHDYGLNRDKFDTALPNQRILRYCKELQIDCLDLTDPLGSEDSTEIYFPLGDMHFNKNGQRMAAQIISKHILNTPGFP